MLFTVFHFSTKQNRSYILKKKKKIVRILVMLVYNFI